jgi:hypothetical protein
MISSFYEWFYTEYKVDTIQFNPTKALNCIVILNLAKKILIRYFAESNKTLSLHPLREKSNSRQMRK